MPIDLTLPTSATNGTPKTASVLTVEDYTPKVLYSWKSIKYIDCGPFYWLGATIDGADATVFTEGGTIFTVNAEHRGNAPLSNQYRGPGFGLFNNSQTLLNFNQATGVVNITNFAAGGNKANNYYSFQPLIIPKGAMGNTSSDYAQKVTVNGEQKNLEKSNLLEYNGGVAGDISWAGTAPTVHNTYSYFKWYDLCVLTLANHKVTITSGTGWTTFATFVSGVRPMYPTCGSLWAYNIQSGPTVPHIVPYRLNTNGELQFAVPTATANAQLWGQVIFYKNSTAAGRGLVQKLTLPNASGVTTTNTLTLEGYHRGWGERVANWPSNMGLASGAGIESGTRLGWGKMNGQQEGTISTSLNSGTWWTVAIASSGWKPFKEVMWLYNQIDDNTTTQSGVRSYSRPMNGRYATDGSYMIAQNSGSAVTVKSPNYGFVYPQYETPV